MRAGLPWFPGNTFLLLGSSFGGPEQKQNWGKHGVSHDYTTKMGQFSLIWAETAWCTKEVCSVFSFFAKERSCLLTGAWEITKATKNFRFWAIQLHPIPFFSLIPKIGGEKKESDRTTPVSYTSNIWSLQLAVAWTILEGGNFSAAPNQATGTWTALWTGDLTQDMVILNGKTGWILNMGFWGTPIFRETPNDLSRGCKTPRVRWWLGDILPMNGRLSQSMKWESSS